MFGSGAFLSYTGILLCVSAESGGAYAEVADDEGCWPGVLLSSRYLSLFFVALLPLTNKNTQTGTLKTSAPIR